MIAAGLALVALTLAQPAWAHVGDRVYPIYQIPPSDLPDLHDGTLGDWDAFLPGPSLEPFDFGPVAVGGAQGLDPADLAWRVYLGWSLEEQRIYVAVERVDNVHVNTYEGGGLPEVWKHDGAEFYIDGDHSGTPYAGVSAASAEEAKLQSNPQRYYLLAASPNGPLALSDNPYQLWSTQPPWFDIGGYEQAGEPSMVGIEAAVTPWDGLSYRDADGSRASRLEAGRIIGFQGLLERLRPRAGRRRRLVHRRRNVPHLA